ncbi:predicted protein [Coccidioides posadasii str. Silveira]|uniref:Predicted protein n=1 Tax=Coccidioides posadasii (strain RMSCC 757 / Silveira) TaxID=443226 RepID=E9D8W8_COCPS|nr:predicted protein [Coccidioides posadasii str. Silveira]
MKQCLHTIISTTSLDNKSQLLSTKMHLLDQAATALLENQLQQRDIILINSCLHNKMTTYWFCIECDRK